jgi:hypothetical protein
MDSLPQELIHYICGYLTHESLRSTLTISRPFQFAAERELGYFEEFTLTSDNAQRFLKFYDSHRCNFLRDIKFRTYAPELPSEWGLPEGYELPHRDTADDLRAIDESFTEQIQFLFKTLKKLEDSMVRQHGFSKISLTIHAPQRHVEEHQIYRKYVCWRVHLLSPETLVELFFVNSLTIFEGGAGQSSCEVTDRTSFKLDLRVLLDLSLKLPNLEYLRCQLISDDWATSIDAKAIRHYTRKWEGPYRDARHDLAEAFLSLGSRLPTSLKEAQLDFVDPFQLNCNIDQRQRLPNLVKPALYNPFSSSLQLLSQQLRKFKLRAVVDESLFWPATGSEPFWPNLESIEVIFHMATPKGNWYFQGMKGDSRAPDNPEGFEITTASYPPLGLDEVDEQYADEFQDYRWDLCRNLQFRVVPNNEALPPFLAGFARAAAKMPSLRKAALWSPLDWNCSDVNQFYEEYSRRDLKDSHGLGSDPETLAWGIIYAAPGERAFVGLPRLAEKKRTEASILNSHQIWWKVGDWKPDFDLHELFQQVGCCSGRENLIEYWEDEVYGQNLVGEEVFDALDIFETWECRRIPYF